MKSVRTAGLLLVAMNAPAALALPPEPDGDRAGWYLTPMYSSVSFDDSRADAGATGYALAFGYRWRWIGVEARGEYVEALTFVDRFTVPGPGPTDPPEERRETGEASLASGQVAVLVQPARLLGSLERLAFLERAYATVGAGMVKRQNSGDRRQDEKAFPYEGGLGYLQPFRLWGFGLALRAEAIYRLDPDPREPDSEPNPQQRYEDLVFRVGIQLPLSPPAPAAAPSVTVVPPAFTDADGDGVVDTMDQCTDTPANSLVNNKGCVPEPARSAP